MYSRRSFFQKIIVISGSLALGSRFVFGQQRHGKIITVTGAIKAKDIGVTLVHEHILVDFIGAAYSNPLRWDKERVVERMLPLLQELKNAGADTIVDCTPAYLGRDPILLKKLSEQSGLRIITNTGFYGGSDHKFLPELAFNDSADRLAQRWVEELTKG